MPILNSKIDDKSIKVLGAISYTPHKEGYDFGINPVDIFNGLFWYLGFNEKIPFINLDSDKGMDTLKEYISNLTEKFKNSAYNKEVVDIQNRYYNRILSDKELDERFNNKTNLNKLKFKIKFIKEGKVMHYVAGRTIRWDDPLIKKIIEVNCGSKFTYKSIDLLLVSKYMDEK